MATRVFCSDSLILKAELSIIEAIKRNESIFMINSLYAVSLLPMPEQVSQYVGVVNIQEVQYEYIIYLIVDKEKLNNLIA